RRGAIPRPAGRLQGRNLAGRETGGHDVGPRRDRPAVQTIGQRQGVLHVLDQDNDAGLGVFTQTGREVRALGGDTALITLGPGSARRAYWPRASGASRTIRMSRWCRSTPLLPRPMKVATTSGPAGPGR